MDVCLDVVDSVRRLDLDLDIVVRRSATVFASW
jgi:hypothetical protein